MPDKPNHGRPQQRSRTRAAILAAAARLMRETPEPTMGDIAREAEVSRGTVYLHFPTLEQLVLEATINSLGTTPEAIAGIAAADPGSGPVQERVAAMLEALTDAAAGTLSLGRSLIRLTVDPGPDVSGVPRRGHRRIATLEQATAPLRDRLDSDDYDRLVSALTLVSGWDALIVLSDVRGLPVTDQRDVIGWAARALVGTALADAGGES